MGRLLALLLRVLVVGVPHVGLSPVVADVALGIRACYVSQVLLVLFHLVLHQRGQGGPEVCDESVESHCLLLFPLVPAHLWEEAARRELRQEAAPGPVAKLRIAVRVHMLELDHLRRIEGVDDLLALLVQVANGPGEGEGARAEVPLHFASAEGGKRLCALVARADSLGERFHLLLLRLRTSIAGRNGTNYHVLRRLRDDGPERESSVRVCRESGSHDGRLLFLAIRVHVL